MNNSVRDVYDLFDQDGTVQVAYAVLDVDSVGDVGGRLFVSRSAACAYYERSKPLVGKCVAFVEVRLLVQKR